MACREREHALSPRSAVDFDFNQCPRLLPGLLREVYTGCDAETELINHAYIKTRKWGVMRCHT